MTELDDTEGVDFVDAIKRRFATQRAEAVERVERRERREAWAGATPAQRGRRGPAKEQFNQRVTPATRELFEALAAHYGEPLSDVLTRAAEALAKATPDLGNKR